MLVISPVEFEKTPTKYCEMAAKGSVFVKYADNYIKLTFTKRLPRKSKNPNNPSPSGDPWFDDPRNLAYLKNRIETSKTDKHYIIGKNQSVREFFDKI